MKTIRLKLSVFFVLLSQMTFAAPISVQVERTPSGVTVNWLHIEKSPTASLNVHIPRAAALNEARSGISVLANLALHDGVFERTADTWKTIQELKSQWGNGKYFSSVKPGRSEYRWHDLKPEFISKAAEFTFCMLSNAKLDPSKLDDLRQALARRQAEVKKCDRKVAMAALGTEVLRLAKMNPPFSFIAGDGSPIETKELESFIQYAYDPRSISVVVAGDMQTIDRDAVRTAIHKYFAQEEKPISVAKNLGSPSFLELAVFVSSKSPRWIEVPGQHRVLRLAFEHSSKLRGRKPWLYDHLFNFLNATSEGSLVDFLEKKGWVEGLYVDGHHRIQNYSITVMDLELTPQGARDREEVVESIFGYLHNIKTRGLSKEEHAVVQASSRAQYFSSGDWADFYSENLEVIENPSEFLSIGSREILNRDLGEVIEDTFDPRQAFVAFVGPGVEATRFNERVGRKTVLKPVSITSWLTAWSEGVRKVPVLIHRAPLTCPAKLRK